jgi:tight adherence protein B
VNDLTIISALVFAAAALGVEVAYWLFFRSRQVRRSIDRRVADSRTLADRRQALDALRGERGFGEFANPLLRRINDMVTQSGLHVDRKLLLLSVVALGGLLLLLLGLPMGYGLGALALALVCDLLLVVLFFRTVRRRRIARFADLLPDSIDVIIRGIRVGYPLPAALDLVAREMPDPIGTEFGVTCDEISFGQDIRTAIENLHRRVGQEDLLFLVMAINVQNQTGGNLAEILSGLVRLLRNRAKVHLKIRALSADGRMSAIVLSLIPFVLFGVISVISPEYFAEVRQHPIIVPALIYAALSLLIGNIVMYRMVNFRF